MKKIGILLSLFVLGSCESDDENGEINLITQIPEIDVSVISSDNTDIFQVDVNFGEEDFSRFNLTQELDLNNLFDDFDLNIDKTTITYGSSLGLNTQTGYKNLSTGNSGAISSYCLVEDSMDEIRQVQFASGSESTLFFVYGVATANAFDTFFVRIFDKTTESCSELPVSENRTSLVQSYLVHENILALQYTDTETQLPEITCIDLMTKERINTFTLENTFRNATMWDGLLYVFNTDNTFSILDLDSSEVVEGGSFNISILLGYDDGLFKTVFAQSQMLYDLVYPQPSAISSGPAVYDFDTGGTINGDDFFLLTLLENAEQELNGFLVATTYVVDLESETVLLGYRRDDNLGSGGIIYSNFSGDILDIVSLAQSPEEIIFREIRR